MNLFKKLKRGLFMTHDELWHHLTKAFQGDASQKAVMDTLEEAFLQSDAGPVFTQEILDALKQKKISHPEEIKVILTSEMVKLLSSFPPLTFYPSHPTVVMLVGVNGTGKTTLAAKLAHLAKTQGKTSLLVAADTFRAAAIEQLHHWAQKTGADFFAMKPGSDPGAVVFQGLKKAQQEHLEFVIIDTAGRLHTKKPLMDELAKIQRVANKALPGAPHHIFLVLDATTGQNGLAQAQCFLDTVPVSGVVLTKLDGSAKGGVVLQIAKEKKLPVRFVGVGEGVEDLLPFEPEAFAHAILE